MRTNDEFEPFVNHLVAQHRRLHHLLTETRQALLASTGDDASAVLPVLQQVRDELEKHFREEDEGGCLDEAVCRCPQLSTECQRIEAEHHDLLGSVDELLATARNHQPTRSALISNFERLCRQIYAHEAAENHLLAVGFGVNPNGDDSGCRCSTAAAR